MDIKEINDYTIYYPNYLFLFAYIINVEMLIVGINAFRTFAFWKAARYFFGGILGWAISPLVILGYLAILFSVI